MPRMRRSALLVVSLVIGCADGSDAEPFADGGRSAPEDSTADTRTEETSLGDTATGDRATEAGFPAGEGVKNAVDRTEPCSAAEAGTFRASPLDESVAQACLPNYFIWAPVVCGGPRPPCACDTSKCAAGEVAKSVSGDFCVCLSPCSVQMSGALCGPSASRRCIPVDDVTKKQVFVCGGT